MGFMPAQNGRRPAPRRRGLGFVSADEIGGDTGSSGGTVDDGSWYYATPNNPVDASGLPDAPIGLPEVPPPTLDPVVAAPSSVTPDAPIAIDPVVPDTPHVDVQLPPLASATSLDTDTLASPDLSVAPSGAVLMSTVTPGTSGYPKNFNPADFPRTIVTDNNGRAVDPSLLMVVLDSAGNPAIVPKLVQGAPSVITAYTPDDIEWTPVPGTGGLVLRKYVNGVATAEAAPASPSFDPAAPEKAFDTLSEAQKLAYWLAVDPSSAGNYIDLAGADGSAHLTDTGKGAIAILQAVGATAAAQAAAGAASTNVSDATAGVVAQVPGGPPAGSTTTTVASPQYTGSTRPADPGVTADPAGPIVTLTDQSGAPSAVSWWKIGLGLVGGLALLGFASRGMRRSA